MKKLVIIISLNIFLVFGSFSQGFQDFTYILGPNIEHSFDQIIDEMPLRVSAGVAVADVNNDTYFDIVFSLGDNKCIKLLLNDGNGFFEERTEAYALDGLDFRSSSPHFFNYNNDEFIDLIIGSVDGTPPTLFKNIDGKRFEKMELPEFDILNDKNTITITSVDFNNDGLQDLFFSHWLDEFEENHFWKNLGDGHFQSADRDLEFYSPHDGLDFCHTANFTDINDDGFLDLLLCSDFGTSQVWLNSNGQKFLHDTSVILDDENAMGSTIGDFDNDGDFDWFVTSVYDDDGVLEGNWGGTGNKFYVNNGLGEFSEQSAKYGLENASWGWGTTFADFNNDGFLDIVVVNGWPQGSQQFTNDRLKIFMSHEAQSFHELAEDFDLIDSLQGRGVSCVDFDNDGRLDILVSNYRGSVKLFRNELKTDYHYLKLNLWESEANSFGHGTKATIFAGNSIQNQIVSNGSNYVSQNPNQLHFGLGNSTLIDSIFITWADNTIYKLYNITSDQVLTIKKSDFTSFESSNSYLYPNPARTRVSGVIKGFDEESLDCYIVNQEGRRIKKITSFSRYEKNLILMDIDISNLRNGQYFITVNLKYKSPITLPFIKI